MGKLNNLIRRVGVNDHVKSEVNLESKRNLGRILIILVVITGFGVVVNAQSNEAKNKFATWINQCSLSSCELLATCNDYPKLMTYTEAIDNCPVGYRLPSIEELECMAKNKPALKLSFWGEYWSGTDTKEDGKAYTITMDDGKREECMKSEKKRVRYIKDSHDNTDKTSVEKVELQMQAPQDWQSTNGQSTEKYALLHLYRPKKFAASLAWYHVDLEDKIDVWQCKNGRRKTIKITREGPFTIHAKTESDRTLTLDIEFGKEYFVECFFNVGAWVGHPRFTLKDENEGRLEFNKIEKEKDDTEQ